MRLGNDKYNNVSVPTHEDQAQTPSPSGTLNPDMDEIQVTEEAVLKMLQKTNPRSYRSKTLYLPGSLKIMLQS